jgi:hypothetical protein
MAMEPLVEIEQSRYDELIRAERKLIALENAGVNTWIWYEEAMEDMESE